MVNFSSHLYFVSQDSVAAVLTRLEAGQSGVLIPVGAWDFPLLQNVETLSGTHPAFYSISTGGSFPSRRVGEAWSWPLTSI